MAYLNLPIAAQEATKVILKNLPSKRMRDILEKRFGLKGPRKQTLEAIGKEYKITRERVRQIEADALRHLRREDNLKEIKPVFDSLHNHIKNHGAVMAEHHVLASSGDRKNHPHVSLLLSVGDIFHFVPESDSYHSAWVVDQNAAAKMKKISQDLVESLEAQEKPFSKENLRELFDKQVNTVFAGIPSEQVFEATLALSKSVSRNPYGEYGLVNWSSISPRGIKDKAYVALSKNGQAMHFLKIAEAINNAGWSSHKAHPQTVHNELIKDSRFVLVGRGLYALKEWGYEPGVIRDVLVSVLKNTGHPMSKEDIIRTVMSKRFVKPPTIMLNLQNKNLFRKTENGDYFLA